MKVAIEVEGRVKALFLNEDSVECLRNTFNQMCNCDPVLKGRLSTHYPTFYAFDKTFGRDMEIELEETIVDGQTIKVHFASYAAIVSRGEGRTGKFRWHF